MVTDRVGRAGPPVLRRGRAPAAAWWLFLGVVGVATIVYFFLPTDAQSILDDVVAVAAAAAMFVGIARNRPEPRFAWVLLAFGVLLFATGDVAYGTSQTVPSPADMLYVSAYPMLVLGLLALARVRLPGPNTSAALDAIVVAVGVGIVTLVFLAVPAGQEQGVGTAARLISIGYPILDLALLGVLYRPIRLATERGLPVVLMGLALLLRLVADVVYVFQNYGTAYTVGNEADAAWLISFACFGAALLHPAVARQDAFLRPQLDPWSRIPPSSSVGLRQPDGSSVVVQGLTGPAVTVYGLDRRHAVEVDAGAEFRAAPVAITWAHALRFRLILVWSGALLLALGGLALYLSASWGAPDVAMLAGAFGITGSLTLIAGAIRS